jgi:hypothetical protein
LEVDATDRRASAAVVTRLRRVETKRPHSIEEPEGNRAISTLGW